MRWVDAKPRTFKGNISAKDYTKEKWHNMADEQKEKVKKLRHEAAKKRKLLEVGTKNNYKNSDDASSGNNDRASNTKSNIKEEEWKPVFGNSSGINREEPSLEISCTFFKSN